MSRQAPGPRARTRLPGPWKNGPIPVIGLVGGIGAGKSAVASRLEALGGFVLDADKIGHALLNQRPVLDRVVARFGLTVLDQSAPDAPPTINRMTLGSIVFSDLAALRSLEAILHPKMRQTFEKAIFRTTRKGVAKSVILDAAVLYEAGWSTLCDKVIFVDSPREARAARLQAGRGWDEQALASREKAQAPLEPKKSRAELVVTNSGDLEELNAEVDRIWALIKPDYRVRHRAETESNEHANSSDSTLMHPRARRASQPRARTSRANTRPRGR